MITFKEYLAEIAIKGKVAKAKNKVTELELRELVKNRDVEGLENADVSEIKDMSRLFMGNAIISDWDTSNVTDMSAMFFSCNSLKEAPKFNTSNVTNMSRMFYGCTSLTKGDMSNWDVSKVKYKPNMFGNCPFPEDKKPKFKD